MGWNSVLWKDMEYEQLGKHGSCYGINCKDEYWLFSESIHYDEDGIMSGGWG